MTHRFDAGVVDAVLRHMNDDHLDDNLLIARAFVPDADKNVSMSFFETWCPSA